MKTYLYENPDMGLTITFDVNGDIVEAMYEPADITFVMPINVTEHILTTRSIYSGIRAELQTQAQKAWLADVDNWFVDAKDSEKKAHSEAFDKDSIREIFEPVFGKLA